MLMEEIQVMMSMDHPSILKIYDVFEWKQAVYIVTE